MIAREQHRRHVDPTEYRGTRIAGIVEQPATKGFTCERLRTKRTREQADRRIEKGKCRDLAAGQNEVAQRALLHWIKLDEPIVDALIVPADDDQAIELCPILGSALGEALAAGRGHDDRASLVRWSVAYNPVENASDGLNSQYHSGAAAEGRVVRTLALGELVEQMMVTNPDNAVFHRSADDREADEWGKELGEERDDLDREH